MLAKDELGDLSGKHCVVLGRSILVGKPAALLFLEQNCTVTIAHSRTKNLEAVCKSADILIAAVGRPSNGSSQLDKKRSMHNRCRN